MRCKFKVHPQARTIYLTRDVIEEGFQGKLDGYRNAVTLTLVHPQASLEDIEASLKVVLDDIELRKRLRDRAGRTNEEQKVAAKF
jgi:hypothetical protein